MYKRTYADRREYIIQAVAKRRRKIRQMAIEYLGGKCINCGYSRCSAALDFHHLNEEGKHFGLSQDGMTRSWEKTKQELQKCIIVCANCHREIHAGILQPSTVMLKRK
jgi:hypothetical protein